jgi:thymidylate synthase (FAD)
MSQETRRPVAIGFDTLIGAKFPVGPDGFVRVVDYMGTDQAIVEAARISYGDGTRPLRKDRGLIRYLLRHRHTTPFEQATIKLHVRVPMDTWRQWIRHRTMSVNEYSTRYSVAIDAAATTAPDAWRLQAEENRQGSDGFADETTGGELSDRERYFQEYARVIYEERIDAGVAREQARKDLPLSTYTEAFITWNLHNLLHFLTLRTDPHAQQEIRQYAETIATMIVARWVPLTHEAWEDYQRSAITLTGPEQAVFRAIIGESEEKAKAALDAMTKREMVEFAGKLGRMGMGAEADILQVIAEKQQHDPRRAITA